MLKTTAETHRILKAAFGENAYIQARIFERFKSFKDDQESVVEDDKYFGQHTQHR